MVGAPVKAAKIKLDIPQGRTFSKVLRWGQPRLVYRQIASATKAAPCILVTDAPHGLPDGWSFQVSNARGMTELNSVQIEDEAPQLYEATVIDSTTIEINALNAAGFQTYTGGGIITYNMPVDLAAVTSAAAQFRPRIDSDEVLLALTTTNGGIVLAPDEQTITLQASAVNTAGFDWRDAVWDLEASFAGGIVLPVAWGEAIVTREITR